MVVGCPYKKMIIRDMVIGFYSLALEKMKPSAMIAMFQQLSCWVSTGLADFPLSRQPFQAIP